MNDLQEYFEVKLIMSHLVWIIVICGLTFK